MVDIAVARRFRAAGLRLMIVFGKQAPEIAGLLRRVATHYPPPRFPSQSSQGDRSRPSSSDSGLIIGLYRTRKEASNGSGKS